MFRTAWIPCLLLAAAATAEEVVCPTAAPSVRTQEFRELWRTDADAPEYLIGHVEAVAIAGDGRVYMLDAQQQEVMAFDAEGKFLGTVAREGEGPGEIQNVWSMSWWNPDTLVLPMWNRTVRVSGDGEPQPDLRIFRHPGDDMPASMSQLVDCGARAVVAGNSFSFGPDGSKSERWVGIIDRDGKLIRELDARTDTMESDPLSQKYDEVASFWKWDRWAATPDGRLFVAPVRDEYRIDEVDAQGEVVRTITRPLKARKRTDEELETLRNSRAMFFNGQKVEIESKLSAVQPPIGGMAVIDGKLWVTLDKAPGDDAYGRYAVHDLDGRLLEEVVVKLPHRPELDVVRRLGDGRFAVVENGIAARQAHYAAFGAAGEENEELEAEPVEVVLYAPKAQ